MIERTDMTHVIILAGGKGKRMNSEQEGPKVLRKVGGVSLILRTLSAVRPICETPTIVVGFGADQVITATGERYHYVHQAEQLGTGHAVACAKRELAARRDIRHIIVLNGDHPFISTDMLRQLVATREESRASIVMATIVVPDFEDYRIGLNSFGRVVRNANGSVRSIVEFKDADTETRELREVNPNYYCFDPDWLWAHVEKLSNTNVAKEFYITDLVGIAVAEGARVEAFPLADPREGLGVNTPEELASAEASVPGGHRAASDSR